MDTTSDTLSNIHRLPTTYIPTLPPEAEPYAAHREQHTPIVIDNGSTNLRWGFGYSANSSTSDEERKFFSGPNAVAKYKERKTNKPLLLFGEAIDSESGARAQTRTAWEGDVLLNFDALENALDYAFIQLGIDTPTVDHPVLMTERLCSPLHSRALTSELMFELYGVPSLTYCIDGLMSFYQNNLPSPLNSPFEANGMVVSFNTASTSVIPMLRGKGLLSLAKRIPWGASQSSEYLLKLIQLKYPNFPTRVTNTSTNWMYHNFCTLSPDFPSLLRSLQNPLTLRQSEVIIQFPFVVPQGGEEKTEEELARIAEKRREQGRRLQEIAAKGRMDKLLQKESDLQYLTNLKETKSSESKREWMSKLQAEGLDSEGALDEVIKKLSADIKKARKKQDSTLEDPDDEPLASEEPSFPLLDIPDADLNEEQIKEKRKQRLLKAGVEARARARKEKEKEREEEREKEKKEEEEREDDLEGWAGKLRTEQENLMAKIKERAKRKAALTDRKSAAAQARMKNIATLASDDRVPVKTKKRKGGGEDLFGANDADWAIYRKINTAAPSSDEEDDVMQLQAIEQKLLIHDPTFTNMHTHASILGQRSALMQAFRPGYEEGDVEGNTRIHLNTERWRVPEAYFSPGMAGVDSAGLGEVMQNLIPSFLESMSRSGRGVLDYPNERKEAIQNIFLTGAPSLLPGLIPRLQSTLQSLLPPGSQINIVRAKDPAGDAWRGMAAFSRTEDFKSGRTGMTREMYDEVGGERIRGWWGGNWNGVLKEELGGDRMDVDGP